MRAYSNILSFFYGHPWAILPSKLQEIEAVLVSRIRSGPRSFDDSPRPSALSSEVDKGYVTRGAAAIISIQGTITPRPSLFSEYSGGASAESLARAVEAAVADPAISAIVLDIDSPGGSVYGLPEAADKIFTARKDKAITAVVNHMAASAAYYFASQANTIAISPAGTVGSIGTIWARFDATKFDELAGFKTELIVNSSSPFKSEHHPEIPMTDAERSDMQATVDAYAQQFIAAVAKGRGVRASVVEKTFGQGRMKLADEAVSLGMADRIATLETIVNEINGVRTAKMKRRVAAGLAAHGLPTV